MSHNIESVSFIPCSFILSYLYIYLLIYHVLFTSLKEVMYFMASTHTNTGNLFITYYHHFMQHNCCKQHLLHCLIAVHYNECLLCSYCLYSKQKLVINHARHSGIYCILIVYRLQCSVCSQQLYIEVSVVLCWIDCCLPLFCRQREREGENYICWCYQFNF